MAETLTELFEQARTAPAQPARKLAPDRHPNRDFFIADLVDWALKNDRHSMEHPMFSLSKKPDRWVRNYEHNGCSVTIEPSRHGLANIWDKDILIYAISQLVEGLNRGREINRTVRVTAYDLLVSTNRHTGGGDYEQLAKSLRRSLTSAYRPRTLVHCPKILNKKIPRRPLRGPDKAHQQGSVISSAMIIFRLRCELSMTDSGYKPDY